MNNNPPKCNAAHSVAWTIDYDIGKKQTEQILVCKECFEDPHDDCFRIFVITKTPVGVVQK